MPPSRDATPPPATMPAGNGFDGLSIVRRHLRDAQL
jgi:hypothetical protein